LLYNRELGKIHGYSVLVHIFAVQGLCRTR
jgi:hypothetical protein